MKKLVTLLVPALVLVAGAFVLPGETISFHVAPKTKLTKSYKTETKLASKHIAIEIDGEDQSDQFGGMSIVTVDTSEIEVVDEYASVAEGRPTKFTRHYEKLGGKNTQSVTFEAGEGDDEDADDESSESTSALEGKHVLFTWDADESEYTRAWGGDDKGDDELYEHARGDMDCLVLLPAKSVAEGDAWDVEAQVMNSILAPGGDLRLRADGADEEDEELDFERALEENLTGKVRATFKGVREEGGVRVGIIAFTADLESKAELDADGDEQAVVTTMKLEGELTWDLKAGHFHALQLSGTLAAVYTSKAAVDGDDGETHVDTKIEFEGELTLTASARE